MENELTKCNLTTLDKLYKKELELLNRSLLRGASWEALIDQRWRVTQLAMILHKRLSSNPDPSSSHTRNHN